MKESAVFMNIGRGPCANEVDLVDALKNKVIAGAVLDVYQTEPLSTESELWDLPNVFMTPHCADGGKLYVDQTFDIFKRNAALFLEGKQMINICDKKLGY